MLELPAALEQWQEATGYQWAYVARLLEVDPITVLNWRKGRSLPWSRKAAHLATLMGRPEISDMVERDRAVLARMRGTAAKPARMNTPRTLIMPAPTDGAA